MEDKKEILKLRLFALAVILAFSLGAFIVYKNNSHTDHTTKMMLLRH